MREGGHRIAVIRPELGFGEKGCKKAGIPPHTPFSIHLHLVKCLLTVCSPNQDSFIQQTYQTKHEGKILYLQIIFHLLENRKRH